MRRFASDFFGGSILFVGSLLSRWHSRYWIGDNVDWWFDPSSKEDLLLPNRAATIKWVLTSIDMKRIRREPINNPGKISPQVKFRCESKKKQRREQITQKVSLKLTLKLSLHSPMHCFYTNLMIDEIAIMPLPRCVRSNRCVPSRAHIF